jgi:flagellar biosynthesis regulator FlaF
MKLPRSYLGGRNELAQSSRWDAVNWTGPDENLHKALMFNRRLWCILFAEVESNESPNSLEVRQGIANIVILLRD